MIKLSFDRKRKLTKMALIGLFAHLPKFGADFEKSYKAVKQIQRFVISTLFDKQQFFDTYQKADCRTKKNITRKCGYQLTTIDKYERIFNAKRDYRTRYYFKMVPRKLVYMLRSDETYLALLCYGNPYVSAQQNAKFERTLIEVYYAMEETYLWRPCKNLMEFLDFVRNFNLHPALFYDLIFKDE